MSFSRPTAYLSYSYEDVDRDSIDAFVSWLIELSNDELNVLYDDDLNPGKDLQEFMKKIYEVDAAIVLLTPSYKKKVLNRAKGGVYTEFNYLYERYSDKETRKKEGRPYDDFALIPILFSGTSESSSLDEISHLKYAPFVHFRAFRDKKNALLITDVIRTTLKSEMTKILSEIMAANSHNSPIFKKEYGKLFKFLFTDTKADWQTTEDNMQTIREIFVKTYPYRKVLAQSRYFLVGRKGSGKSTVAAVMANQSKDQYLGTIQIVANEFNLELLYGFLSSSGMKSDTKHIFKIPQLFAFSWVLFLYIWKPLWGQVLQSSILASALFTALLTVV